MAAKVKCPGCGAKNAHDARRCRICTAVINADIPEGGPVVEAPTDGPQTTFDAGQIDRQLGGGRSSFGGASGLGARIAAAGNSPTMPEPPMPPAFGQGSTFGEQAPTGPATAAGPEPWSTDTSWSTPTPATPDLPTDVEPFDPNALFDTAPPGGDGSPPPAGPQEFEPFDPDALFRDS